MRKWPYKVRNTLEREPSWGGSACLCKNIWTNNLRTGLSGAPRQAKAVYLSSKRHPHKPVEPPLHASAWAWACALVYSQLKKICCMRCSLLFAIVSNFEKQKHAFSNDPPSEKISKKEILNWFKLIQWFLRYMRPCVILLKPTKTGFPPSLCVGVIW